jgi:hypothetical protein
LKIRPAVDASEPVVQADPGPQREILHRFIVSSIPVEAIDVRTLGAALNTASATDAYLLSDRGTWLSFENKGHVVIVVEGVKRLFNQYGVMLVNPEKHPTVKNQLANELLRLPQVR